MPDWVELHPEDNPDPTLSLGAGEREAITLVFALKADMLLIDERKGRRAALARGLAVSGTLNILDAAAERGLIELAPTIAELQQTNLRISPELIQELLKRDAHRKSSGEAKD